MLDKNDAEFGKFVVWQDLNSNGISEEGEVKSLAEWGIESISLSADREAAGEYENVSNLGTGSFKMKSGDTGKLHDAAFYFDKGEAPAQEDPAPAPDIL